MSTDPSVSNARTFRCGNASARRRASQRAGTGQIAGYGRDREVRAAARRRGGDASAVLFGCAIGVYPQRWDSPTGPLCLALWGVNDPGNVGTSLRSALAFGASSVALIGGGAGHMRPGEVSCAHGGVLFLDEMGEFAADRVPPEPLGILPRIPVRLGRRHRTSWERGRLGRFWFPPLLRGRPTGFGRSGGGERQAHASAAYPPSLTLPLKGGRGLARIR